MQVVAHNLVSQNAQRQFKLVSGGKAKSSEKLGSGYRINRAADDAAGLAISEKMRAQIRGLDKATDNISHGISFVQVADGALNEIHSMIHRMKELATQASNDTNSDTDREQLNNEVKQLKKEINRVFNTTEFNTKPIFKSPYSLGVTDDPEPLDIQLFNTTEANNSPNGTSGIIVNSRRYTWEEMGASVTNGVFDNDWEFDYVDGTANNGDGERIHMYASAGSTIDQAFRRYHVTADSEGLYVNKVPAARWDDTAATGKWAGVPAVPDSDGEYTFTYHGMEVSFVPDEEDGREEMIEHLNPTELDPEDKVLYWDVKFDKGNHEDAVVSSGVNMSENRVLRSSSNELFIMDVTEANKGTLSNPNIENWVYEVSASKENGVTIKQTTGNDGITHKTIAWSDFKDSVTGERFPFSDWGEGSDDQPETFDHDAVYIYEDTTTTDMEKAIKFSFRVADEASFESIVNGLNELTITGSDVSAPLNAGGKVLSGESVLSTVTLNSHSGLDFHYQRDVLLRTFDEAVSDITGTVKRTRTVTGTQETAIEARNIQAAYVKKITETWAPEYETEKNSDGSTKLDENGDPVYKFLKDDEDHLILDGGGNPQKIIIGYTLATTSYNWEELTNQNPGDTTGSKESGTTTRYELSGSSFTYYTKDSGGNYNYATNHGLYVASESGDRLDLDHRSYSGTSIGSGSSKKYIDTTGVDEYIKDRTYNTYKDTYTLYNKNNAAIMTFAISNAKVDILTGVKDHNGNVISETDLAVHRAYDNHYFNPNNSSNASVSLYYKASDGSLKSKSMNTNYSADTVNLTGSGGQKINMTYQNYDDPKNEKYNSLTVKITPSDEAKRTFTKNGNVKGGSYESHFKIEVPPPPEKLLHIQSGSQPWQSIDLIWRGMSLSSIGLGGANVTTYDKAQRTMALADAATDIVSSARANFGAYQNRLEHAYDIDNNTSENTSYAESRIRDTDMAKEMVNYSKHSILEQAGLSVLSQANSANQGVISLLG